MPVIGGTSTSATPGAGKLLPRTRITGRGQVQRAWDETPGEHVYHASPEENFHGIQGGGLKSSLKKGFSAGVHFSPEPDYPVIGDRPMNYYRVRREDIPGLEYRSSGDVHTPHDIGPEHVEVYTGTPETGPHWSGLKSAYDAGTGLMALAQLATIDPRIQERFPRTSWLLSGGPLGDLAAASQERIMHETGLDKVYAPGQHWSEQVPSYTRMGHSVHGGRARPRRYTQTVSHQAPPGTELL